MKKTKNNSYSAIKKLMGSLESDLFSVGAPRGDLLKLLNKLKIKSSRDAQMYSMFKGIHAQISKDFDDGKL